MVSSRWCFVFSATASGRGFRSAPAMWAASFCVTGETSLCSMAISHPFSGVVRQRRPVLLTSGPCSGPGWSGGWQTGEQVAEGQGEAGQERGLEDLRFKERRGEMKGGVGAAEDLDLAPLPVDDPV